MRVPNADVNFAALPVQQFLHASVVLLKVEKLYCIHLGKQLRTRTKFFVRTLQPHITLQLGSFINTMHHNHIADTILIYIYQNGRLLTNFEQVFFFISYNMCRKYNLLICKLGRNLFIFYFQLGVFNEALNKL